MHEDYKMNYPRPNDGVYDKDNKLWIVEKYDSVKDSVKCYGHTLSSKKEKAFKRSKLECVDWCLGVWQETE